MCHIVLGIVVNTVDQTKSAFNMAAVKRSVPTAGQITPSTWMVSGCNVHPELVVDVWKSLTNSTSTQAVVASLKLGRTSVPAGKQVQIMYRRREGSNMSMAVMPHRMVGCTLSI